MTFYGSVYTSSDAGTTVASLKVISWRQQVQAGWPTVKYCHYVLGGKTTALLDPINLQSHSTYKLMS
jgi:hypothetical protein